MITTSVPGRVCLAGEKLDWLIGGKSITCALEPFRLTAELSPNSSNRVLILSETRGRKINLEEFELPASDSVRNFSYGRAVFLAYKKIGIEITRGARISIRSTLPRALGLASSAALCSALVGSVSQWLQLGLTRTTIANLAYVAEKEILGIMCGQMDQCAVVFGGVCCINCSVMPAEVIQFSKELHGCNFLVAYDRNQKVITNNINSRIQNLVRIGDRSIHEYIEGMTQIVSLICQLFKTDDFSAIALGEAMTEGHLLASKVLNVSNPRLDKAIESAISAGAWGAKLSSGKSGAIFALSSNRHVESTRKAMMAQGLTVIDARIDSIGLMDC